MTSLWLAKKYDFGTVVAVEPSAENAELVRKNLADNGVNATVVEAAVGPRDGTAVFAASEESNMGRVGEDGQKGVAVKLLTMNSILKQANVQGCIDLLKLDIEGGEEALVDGELSWLGSVRRIIAELHPAIVDTDKVIAAFEERGLKFFPGTGDLSAASVMDLFVRENPDGKSESGIQQAA